MLKVGDKLLCNYDKYGNYYNLIKGKSYEIRTIDIKLNIFEVADDRGDLHCFSFAIYHIWFYTEKQMRMKKLERLSNV